MSASEDSIIAKKRCIGVNRYSGRTGKSMYLNCIDNLPINEDNLGQTQVQLRANYDDYHHFIANPPSLDKPVLVTMEGHFQVFQGQQSFACDKVVKVEPYKPVASQAIPSKNP